MRLRGQVIISLLGIIWKLYSMSLSLSLSGQPFNGPDIVGD